MAKKGGEMNTESLNYKHQELKRHISSRYEGESYIQTAMKPLSFFVHTESTDMLSILYEPSLCVIVQGSKAVGVDDDLFSYDPDTYLLASVHTPARICITEASSEHPYMGLTITFSMEQIFDVLKEIDQTEKRLPKGKRRLYFGTMEDKLLNPILRLVGLLDTPEDIAVLSPLIIKEILYFVMRTEGGDFIRQFVMDGSSTQQVVKAISHIKENFSEMLNISELAKSIGMSESSLYSSFKKITALSPLQFQKTLRLQEARRRLMIWDREVSQIAFEVGYESPSQFSREYSRMYGISPKTDAKRMRGVSVS
jgi:AraC-like DNA-binding protein